MSDDNVIHAFPVSELPENLLTIEARSEGVPYYCQHEAVSLNQHERSVHCARCNAVLDPFNFLLENARTLRMAWANYREAQHKVVELNERIAVLQKTEKRLRAQVGRLKDKTVLVNPRAEPQ